MSFLKAKAREAVFFFRGRYEIFQRFTLQANVDDRNPEAWNVLTKKLYGRLFADRGYISPRLLNHYSKTESHIVTGINANMKNKLMPLWDKIMLRKRYVIECINDMLKNTAKLVHSRHRSINNFLMNLIAALGVYCFFDNKPEYH